MSTNDYLAHARERVRLGFDATEDTAATLLALVEYWIEKHETTPPECEDLLFSLFRVLVPHFAPTSPLRCLMAAVDDELCAEYVSEGSYQWTAPQLKDLSLKLRALSDLIDGLADDDSRGTQRPPS